MQKTTHKEILIPADLAVGLITVLQSALTNGQLKGKEKRFAKQHVEMLEKAMKTHEQRARVGLSVRMVADILRIILMIIKPDPLVKAAIEILGRVI